MTAIGRFGCTTEANDWDPFEGLCRAVALGAADVHTFGTLATAIEQAARDANLHDSGPSHADPLQGTVRVGVFVEPLAAWPPPA